jgi:Zinc carboxypeptidase
MFTVASKHLPGDCMKPIRVLIPFLLLILLLVVASISYAEYRSSDQLSSLLKNIARGSNAATLHELGESSAGNPLSVLEVGEKGPDAPGVLVVANMTGDAPLTSEAAIRLAEKLTGEWADKTLELTWYIYTCGNPDGYASFFESPQVEEFRNGRSFNDDGDMGTDEDGPDDLNDDGFITLMRQRHPDGEWTEIDDKPYMRLAESGKGETGQYKIFQEGFDNDNDGQINEDGPGGVNPGNNFPHRFELHTVHAGMWAASETASRELMTFAFERPNIAMVIVFGRSNTLLNVPESSRKKDLLNESFSVPGWMARRAGLKRGARMKLGELLPIARDAFNRPTLTADRLLGWLSDEAESEPHPKDLVYWNEIAERYSTFIDSSGASGDRLDPPDPVPGSIEEWAYFQYGTPVFALDFWTVPEPVEAEADSSAGEDEPRKKENDESDEGDPEKDALLAFRPDAWIDWTAYDHPTLGDVEIGGLKPFSYLAPPAEDVDSLLEAQLPFVLELTEYLPRIEIADVTVIARASGVYQVEAWVTNTGFLPYPTYHGSRTQRPIPVSLTIEGVQPDAILEGKHREVLGLLEGNGGSEKVRWVVSASTGSKITLNVWSWSAGTDKLEVTLEGGQR